MPRNPPSRPSGLVNRPLTCRILRRPLFFLLVCGYRQLSRPRWNRFPNCSSRALCKPYSRTGLECRETPGGRARGVGVVGGRLLFGDCGGGCVIGWSLPAEKARRAG